MAVFAMLSLMYGVDRATAMRYALNGLLLLALVAAYFTHASTAWSLALGAWVGWNSRRLRCTGRMRVFRGSRVTQ